MTAHNAIPHVNGEIEAPILSKIYSLVDLIIVHGNAVKEEINFLFPKLETPIFIQPHGAMLHRKYINGNLYVRTEDEYDVLKCGMMDGEITSTVDDFEIPTQDNQSNFGEGYGYQYMGENNVNIYIFLISYVGTISFTNSLIFSESALDALSSLASCSLNSSSSNTIGLPI